MNAVAETREFIHRVVRSAPACEEQRRRSREEGRGEGPERPRERDSAESWSFNVERTDPGDAFTYLTCNNLEKVLTMARGSPQSSER